MKKIVLLMGLLFCLLMAESCRKDRFDLAGQLVGRWELRKFTGSFLIGNLLDTTPGNKNIWNFSDTAYQHYSNGQLYKSGFYTLTKTDTFSSGVPEDALILDGDPYSIIHFSIIKDTLTLYVGSIPSDGYIAKYVKY